MSLFWDLQGPLSPASSMAAAQAESGARAAQRQASDVEARLDRILLACEAMWTLLREKLGLTDVELIERVNAIDLSDGKLDGQVRRTPASCPKCGRTISMRFPKCMYCGQAIVHDPFA